MRERERGRERARLKLYKMNAYYFNGTVCLRVCLPDHLRYICMHVVHVVSSSTPKPRLGGGEKVYPVCIIIS